MKQYTQDNTSSSAVLFNQTHGNNRLSDTEYDVYGWALIFTGIIGLLGDGLFLLAVVRFPVLRTPTNLLLLGLLSTDAVMITLVYPITISAALSHGWPFSDLVCQFQAYVLVTTLFCSMGMLMIISIDRYIQVCKTSRPLGDRVKWKYYSLTIAAVWVHSMLWALGPLVGWSSYGVDPVTDAHCFTTYWNSDQLSVSYATAVFVIAISLPMTVVVYCYFRCIKFIRQKRKEGNNSTEDFDWTNEKQITKMSVVCVIGFFLCFAPGQVILIYGIFADPTIIFNRATVAGTYFAYASAMINPVIYFSTNRRLHRAYKALFLCRTDIDLLKPSDQ